MAHFQFVFYIFCIIWNESYLSKYLVTQLIWHANPDIQGLVFYQTQSFSFLYDCKQFKSLFFSYRPIHSKKKLTFPDRLSPPDYSKAMRLRKYLHFALFTFYKVKFSFIPTFYFFIIMT